MENGRGSGPNDARDVRDEATSRKVYAPPRLTRWGAIPRVTEAFDNVSALPG
jgi:hypothetical protein